MHRVLFLPGLDDRLLDGGAMPELRRRASEARRAILLPSGLDLPACLRANALWGRGPRAHGITLDESTASPPLQAHPQLTVEADDSLLQRALEHGVGSGELLDAARDLDERIALWLGEESESAWILGGNVPLPKTGSVERPEGSRIRGAIAEFDVPPSRGFCDELLGRKGIERVLSGESLLAWGLPRSVLICEAGFSFEEGAAVLGHPNAAATRRAPVLCWRGNFQRPWPASVHDTRLAPTLASWLQLSDDEFDESELG